MARNRLDQPYESYDPDSGTLHQSTHAPGQGGSSGAAIGALSRGATGRGNQMANAYQGAFVDAPNSMDSRLQNRYQNALGRNANAQAFNDMQYDRGMGQGTRFERETERQQRQMLDDQRERDLYEQQQRRAFSEYNKPEDQRLGELPILDRLRFGMQSSFGNALADSVRGRQQFFGPQSSYGGQGGSVNFLRGQAPQDDGIDRERINNALTQFLMGRFGGSYGA